MLPLVTEKFDSQTYFAVNNIPLGSIVHRFGKKRVSQGKHADKAKKMHYTNK